MKQDIISSIKISSAFLGSLIGAGFASGQEVMIYFGVFGRFGALGVLVCAVLLFLLVAGICAILRKTGARDFKELLLYTCGRTGARIFMAVFLMFTFIAFGVMAAGFGESIMQHIGIDKRVGAFIFLIIMVLVMRAGERGVVAVNVALTPVMIISVLLVSIYILYRGGIAASSGSAAPAAASAILYAGYNGILGIAVIAQLSHMVRSRTVGMLSAIISSGSFIILLIPLYVLMIQNYASLSHLGIPMLYAATMIHPAVGHLYFLILLMAMVTTGACCGFSLCGSMNLNMKRGSWMIPLCALPFLLFDFSTLVSHLYSLFGIAGSILLFIVVFQAAAYYVPSIRKKHSKI